MKPKPLIPCVFAVRGCRHHKDAAKPGVCCPGRLAEHVSFACLSLLRPQLSYVMSGYRCFVCPVEYNNDTNSFTVDCEPSDLFRLHEYNIPEVIQSAIGWVCATPMERTDLSGVAPTRESPLSTLPSLIKSPSCPHSCRPQEEGDCSHQFMARIGGDFSSHFKPLGPVIAKCVLGNPGGP